MLNLYARVPKDLKANLEYRRKLTQLGREDEDAAAEFRAAAAADVLFYVNTFAFYYEPRPGHKRKKVGPFITWPYQDRAILAINDAIDEGHDLVVEKSRDMGATWLCLLVFHWRWLTRPLEKFLLVSRKEEYVDEKGNQDTLFWKLEWLTNNLPGWMRPNCTRLYKRLLNEDIRSTLVGESTNSDLGAGGRNTAILLDEFARVANGWEIHSATSDNTDCRIFNSTPKGKANCFYQQCVLNTPPEHRLRLHWSEHPLKAAGLHFVEGKPHSPWYDRECLRRPKQEVASELDIDYGGSDYQFFDGAYLEELVKRDARDPYRKLPASQFSDKKPGQVLLWCNLDGAGQPPGDRQYVVGVDISAGTGASNSAVSVCDRQTGEKVAEYADPTIRAEGLAELVIGLCQFFKGLHPEGAFLIWEANNFGRNFGSKVQELGYTNFYLRTDDTGLSPKVSKIPGWYTSPDSKRAMLYEYREALGVKFINRSVDAIKECGEYIHEITKDAITHSRSLGIEDPTGARANHGDRVIADALCWQAMKGTVREHAKQKYDANNPPVGTLAWRIWHAAQQKAKDFWGGACA